MRGRWILGTASVVVVVLLAVSAIVSVVSGVPDLATPTPRPAYSAGPTSSTAVCQEATNLIDDGRPKDAQTLIEAARKNRQAAPATATPAPGSLLLCEKQFDAALVADGQLRRGAIPDSNPAQDQVWRVGQAWARFVGRVAAPLKDVALAALGVFLGLLVIARVGVLLVGRWLRKPLRLAIRSWWRTAVGWLAVVLMAVFAILLPVSVAFGPTATIGPVVVAPPTIPIAVLVGPFTFTPAFIAIAVVVGGVASALVLSFVLAARLRLTIELSGKEADASLAPLLAALVIEIGGALPRGPEIPVGSDATAMRDNVIAVKSSNTWVSAAQTVLSWLFVTTPWHVTLGVAEAIEHEPSALSLVITRNTFAISAYAISTEAVLNLPTREDDAKSGVDDARSLVERHLLSFAASAVVTTMQRYYRGFEGLSGTTDWRSLGLQYIATARRPSDAAAKQVLAVAMRQDPENLLALIALQRIRAGSAEKADDWRRYRLWLQSTLRSIRTQPWKGSDSSGGNGYKVLPGREDAHVRLMLSTLVAVLNTRGTELGAPLGKWVEREVVNLRAQLAATDVRSSLYKVSRPTSEILAASTRVQTGYADPDDVNTVLRLLDTASPYVAYNAACFLTCVLRSGAAGDRASEVLASLKRAIGTAALDSRLRSAMEKDRILSSQTDSDWFEPVAGNRTDADG